MLGASVANVFQAREKVKRYPLFALLAWAMALGAVMDGLIALVFTGPPVIEARLGYWLGLSYLALFASALAFSLYLPSLEDRAGESRLFKRDGADHRHDFLHLAEGYRAGRR